MFTDLYQDDQFKLLLIFIICISTIVFLYYVFIIEGFDNKTECKISTHVVRDAKKTMDEIKRKFPSETPADKINLGFNYRDMLTRDIILGNDNKTWCEQLTIEEKEEILNHVSNNSYLFDNTDLMDDQEMEQNNLGIEYSDASLFEQKYAKA